MAQGDLTVLANVQAWLSDGGKLPPDQLGVVSRLITSCSQATLAYLQRAPFALATYTQAFDGRGTGVVFLKQWPALSVSAVSVDNSSLSEAQGSPGAGWLLEAWDGYPPGQPQAVELQGYRFSRGRLNCKIVYQAGYAVQGEAQTVPSTTPYQITPNLPYGPWLADGGVTYAATGVALTLVTGAPSAGQYAVAAGLYTFATADEGADVLLAYSFVPSAIEAAVIEWVGERYKTRGRIGEKSTSLGGQATASYDRSDIPAFIATQLQPFRRVLPI